MAPLRLPASGRLKRSSNEGALRSRDRRKLEEHWSFRSFKVSAAAQRRCEKSTRRDFCRPGDQCGLAALGDSGRRWAALGVPNRIGMRDGREFACLRESHGAVPLAAVVG